MAGTAILDIYRAVENCYLNTYPAGQVELGVFARDADTLQSWVLKHSAAQCGGSGDIFIFGVANLHTTTAAGRTAVSFEDGGSGCGGPASQGSEVAFFLGTRYVFMIGSWGVSPGYASVVSLVAQAMLATFTWVDVTAFTPSACVEAPSGTSVSLSGSDSRWVVRTPTGWTKVSTPSEIDALDLSAPGGYQFLPTRIAVLAFMPGSPSEIAHELFDPPPHGVSPEYQAFAVGAAVSCNIAGGQATVYAYVSRLSQIVAPQGLGPAAGYVVILQHGRFSYGLRLEGTAGVDARAIDAARQMLGSWTWS